MCRTATSTKNTASELSSPTSGAARLTPRAWASSRRS
ncbi:hypothetical protein MUK42_03048 [Musa troglodytarum]|uniref:Uncharacterized protein n=1 Tax=Musa troglodytarum TaxID=320322 RepID=A0A9E7K706_9LILI|nr:hypothetical protein MUK42_03048 [Musa troglodytarum]